MRVWKDIYHFLLENLMCSAQGESNAVRYTIRPRVWIVGTIIAFIYSLLLVQIITITLLPSGDRRTYYTTASNPDNRADIYDRKGVLVADMLKTKGVRVNPRMVKDADTLTRDLIRIYPDISYEDMYKRITKKSSLVLLQRNISDAQHNAIVAFGDTYGAGAVSVIHRKQLFVNSTLLKTTDTISTQIVKLFPRMIKSQIEDKLHKGQGNVLISSNLTAYQENAIQNISKSYDEDVLRVHSHKTAYLKPRLVSKPDALSDALSKIFPKMTRDRLYNLVVRKSDYVWIKRRTTPEQQYYTNALGNVAIKLENSTMRIYPQGNLFSHVIGYVNVDNNGISGIEQAKNDVLLEQNIPVYLTIDAGVQHIVRSEILNIIKKTDAVGGVGIVMDVNNGEVVSMVSLPDFDPNKPMFTTNEDNKFNRATKGVYELGSTFKIINSAFALDSKKVDISDIFDARKPLRIGRFTIGDYHAKNRKLDVSEVFVYSSNIGSALMADAVGTDAQKHMMEKLGFLKSMDIILPEKSHTLYPRRWKRTETMTISYGHGIAITPLHLTASIASLINGGYYYTPKFIKTDTQAPVITHKVISQETSHLVRKLMRLNTLDGSGRKSAVKGFVVGGKTGTADKVKATGGYDTTSLISSYIAGFPMHKPQYVVYVMIDSPKAGKYTNGLRPTGGQVAAPAIGNIVKRIAPLLGVNPIDENSKAVKDLKIPSYERRKMSRKKI